MTNLPRNYSDFLFAEKDGLSIVYSDDKIKIFRNFNSFDSFYSLEPFLTITIDKTFIQKDILNIIFDYVSNKDIKSSDDLDMLLKFIQPRIDMSTLKQDVFLYGGVDEDGEIESFNSNKSFLEKSKDIIGIVDINKYQLYNIEKISPDYKHIEDGSFYSLWDIVSNSIKSSYIFQNLLLTKTCFHDFGKKDLDRGSFFVKFKVKQI